MLRALPLPADDTRLPEAQLATGAEVLRTIAVSRLMLDSIPHIKAYRMNVGDGLGELALRFGADDIDGTVHKESIMHLAGSTARWTLIVAKWPVSSTTQGQRLGSEIQTTRPSRGMWRLRCRSVAV